MRAGRVPVIIADEWVEPRGLDWATFSIRVKEQNIKEIPTILERFETSAETMGNAAQLAWNKFFSESGSFEWLGDACERIQSGAGVYDSTVDRSIFAESLRPVHRRKFYRELAAEKLRHYRNR